MKSWLNLLTLLCIGVIFMSLSAHAQTASDWTFSLPTGDISGPAGSTIGWGYTITNNSTDWLWATDVASTDNFQHGTATTDPFDYPALAPGSSVTVDYTAVGLGLADLTWDDDAPAGYVNSSTFQLTSYFYDGDPFAGGNYIGPAGTHEAAYTATVMAPVPEASTLVSTGLLLCLGLGGLAWSVSRRKAQSVE